MPTASARSSPPRCADGRIGRRGTLTLVLAVQAALMFAAIPITGNPSSLPVVVVLLATLIGFNYGANLALFPSFAKDFWGLKNFGINYGGGVMVFLTDNIGIRGDIRQFRSLQNDDLDDDFPEPGDFDLGDFKFWRATAGLTFRF